MGLELEDIVWLGVVTVAGAYQLAMFAMAVGASRRKHKIEPPTMEGPDEFNRICRAQQNSVEFFPIFILCLWMSGIFFHQVPAAILGVVYIYARHSYFHGYHAEAKQRIPGFKLSAQTLRLYLGLCVMGLVQVLLLTYAGINVKAILLNFVKGFTGY